MKIIHTGDWHIGKIVNEFSMIEDQKFILEQLIGIIEEEKPHALIIAGDLYDRSIPPVEAVELLDGFFNKILIQLKTPILAIAGNHDSAERLSFGSKLFNESGLHIAGVFSKEIKKISLNDGQEDFCFYLVPYKDPREVKAVLQDEEITSHDAAMRKIIELIKTNMAEGEKNVLVAHGYISFMKETSVDSESENIAEELETSDSERPLSIGGTDLINGQYFDCFNYTALGHLHGPQKVGSDKMRYSGSLLKYSFSEKDHKKGVSVVEFDSEGQVSVTHRELIPRRDMRVIQGPLKELISPEVYSKDNVEDYIYAILTDKEELIDPISKLRAVYPNIMGLHREEGNVREDSKTSASSDYKSKTKLQLFEEFYESIAGKALSEEKLHIVEEIIESVEREVK